MPSNPRPYLKVSYEPWMVAAEILTVLVLIGTAIYSVISYQSLPETIPTHFGVDGEANGFGSRATLFFPLVVAVFIYLLLTLIGRFPRIFNYPWRVTEANARRLYTVSVQLLVVLKLEMVALFAYIVTAIVRYATVAPGPFDIGFLFVTVAIIFGTIIVGIISMRPSTWDRA
jgi:uncharacterized membrane protein